MYVFGTLLIGVEQEVCITRSNKLDEVILISSPPAAEFKKCSATLPIRRRRPRQRRRRRRRRRRQRHRHRRREDSAIFYREFPPSVSFSKNSLILRIFFAPIAASGASGNGPTKTWIRPGRVWDERGADEREIPGALSHTINSR